MFSRLRILAILVVLGISLSAYPVYAGGWAVISLDELPTGVVVGEPITIGFTVLQHGRTPMPDLDPTIKAELSNADQLIVQAVPEGKVGHYTATLTFPKAGEWSWSIQAFTMDQPMPVLTVGAGAATSANQIGNTTPLAPTNNSISMLWIVRGLALGIGLIGLGVALKRNNRKALALTGLCLVVGVGSFVTGSAVPEAEAQSKAPVVEMASDSSISQVELGRQLFVAKGCITCHVNRRVANSSEYWTIDMGAPDLSIYASDPEILRTRLKNPSEVNASTKMPNLGLKEGEIEALIAFINSK